MVMTDPYAAAGGLDPNRMSADEHLAEVAAIFAVGLSLAQQPPFADWHLGGNEHIQKLNADNKLFSHEI
jgi:hypothetical protein